jgi:radical SAM enzyme (rSAM/lipoprotein system)
MTFDKIPLRKKISMDLFSSYRHIHAKLHQLTYLFWECTLRCNFNCLHCGSDCFFNNSVPDMDAEDFLAVLDLLVAKEQVNPNKTTISITGGEPLMRNDLEECGSKIAERNFPWGFVTNGLLLSKDRYNALLQAGLKTVTISLDGLRDTHNWLRNNTSYDKVLEHIAYVARDDSIMYDVITCVNHNNFHQLDKIKELLINLGVKRWRLFDVFPKGRAKDNPAFVLSKQQYIELMEFIKRTRQEKIIKVDLGCEGFLGNYESEVRDGFFFCRAGINVASVLADGSISACPSLREDYIQGSIYKDDFVDVWNNRFQKMRNREWTKTGVCAKCEVYEYCEGNGLHIRHEKTGQLLRCQYKTMAG